MSLFDLIKAWIETSYKDLIVEQFGFEPDIQIRISIAPGVKQSIFNSIAAIYEDNYKGRRVYYRALRSKDYEPFWHQFEIDMFQTDYISKLQIAVDRGLENYRLAEKWDKANESK